MLIQKHQLHSENEWFKRLTYLKDGVQPKTQGVDKEGNRLWMVTQQYQKCKFKKKNQAAWTSSVGAISLGAVTFGVLSTDFDKLGMYLQQRLWTPLIFLGASVAGRPAFITSNINLHLYENNIAI